VDVDGGECEWRFFWGWGCVQGSEWMRV